MLIEEEENAAVCEQKEVLCSSFPPLCIKYTQHCYRLNTPEEEATRSSDGNRNREEVSMIGGIIEQTT